MYAEVNYPTKTATPDGWVETDRAATDMRTWEHETKPAWIVTHASNADDPAPFGWAAGLDQDGHYLRTGKAATWGEAATAALPHARDLSADAEAAV
jgi:hypothetical protein